MSPTGLDIMRVLGGLDYLAKNPDKLMEMRLNFCLRGINKVEDPKAEKWTRRTWWSGREAGLKKAEKFPDYYVIPMGLDKDNDSQEAFNMIDYFKLADLDKELKEKTAATIKRWFGCRYGRKLAWLCQSCPLQGAQMNLEGSYACRVSRQFPRYERFQSSASLWR